MSVRTNTGMTDEQELRQMSIQGQGHFLTGDAPLCAECRYRLGGEDFAFREPSGVWLHHDCGLRLGNEEIEARGLMLEQVSEGQGYLNTTPAGPESSASFGHRLAAEADHEFMRERLSGKRSLSGVAAEVSATRNAAVQQFQQEDAVLGQVNEWRAQRGLEPVTDWSTWKRMGKRVDAPLPTPKQRGGCLKIVLVGTAVTVVFLFVVPLVLGLIDFFAGGGL